MSQTCQNNKEATQIYTMFTRLCFLRDWSKFRVPYIIMPSYKFHSHIGWIRHVNCSGQHAWTLPYQKQIAMDAVVNALCYREESIPCPILIEIHLCWPSFELFCGVVCVVTLPFWDFCWCRGFCHRTESDLFLFLQVAREVICIFAASFFTAWAYDINISIANQSLHICFILQCPLVQ